MSDKTHDTLSLTPLARVHLGHCETISVDATRLVRAAFERAYRLGYGNGHTDAEECSEYDPRPSDAFEMYVAGDLDDMQVQHTSEAAP